MDERETPKEEMSVKVHRTYGPGEDAGVKARRYARSATRQARPGVTYEAIEDGHGWFVVRITRGEQER